MSKADQPILVSAWTNGQGFYGLKVLGNGREEFEEDWDEIKLALPGIKELVTIPLSPSFWKKCAEVRSSRIGEFLDVHGCLPWPPKRPPRFRLRLEAPARFSLDFIHADLPTHQH